VNGPPRGLTPGTVERQATAEDLALVARLRAGDEQAFEALISGHYSTMLAVARRHVGSRAVADEVVQETWLGVLQGLDRFEGRSSLKTWIFAILVNRAKTRGLRERRTVPFASLGGEPGEPAVGADRFQGASEPFPGHWRRYPAPWGASPDVVAEDRETVRAAMRAIAELPPVQQAVIRMRDLQGMGSDEVCEMLEVSPANQRVLLHRARSHVRTALEGHFDG
jgi:RNA polymerase sigma-70 factor (ECF subfamily)